MLMEVQASVNRSNQFAMKNNVTHKQPGVHPIPRIGDRAPDAALTDTNGFAVNLSYFWRERPTVVVFLRHFGCPFCREQILILRKAYNAFKSSGIDIVCVGQGPHKAGKAFSVYFDLPFPILVCGDDYTVYGNYGLLKATHQQLYGFQVLLRGMVALKNGIRKSEGDNNQMPGVFAVNTSGAVIYTHRSLYQADNIDAEALLAVIVRETPLIEKRVDDP
jgi:peroxiredoxin